MLQSQQVEKRQNISEDQKRLEMIERLYNEVTIEVEKEYANRTKAIKAPNKKLKDIDDAEEIWEYLEYSRNPADSEVCIVFNSKKSDLLIRTSIFTDGTVSYAAQNGH